MADTALVESTIRLDDGRELVWHSPVSGGGAGIELWNRLWPSEVGGVGTWRPRQPGEPMPAHEVARDLLAVEDWLGPVEWPYGQHLHIPRDSMAAEHPDVVRWAQRHPAPPRTWPSALRAATAAEHPLTWTATGGGDCMGDHDPDTFTTGCQLGDGYEHDLTTEGCSSIAWMLLGGRPPADDGDCDAPRCALSGPYYTPCTYADCDLDLGGGCVLRGPA